MKGLLSRIISNRSPSPSAAETPRPVFVVSGLPRSGTSMMMKMLEAGGLEVISDGIRTADDDNPKGYYEFERVKDLDKGDTAWVADARGKVVKVISALLQHLPPEYRYKVIFMDRKMEEVLASQRKMLQRRGEQSDVDDETMGRLLAKHVQHVKAWLREQPNFECLEVSYNGVLEEPLPYVREVIRFLGEDLDEARMLEVVEPALYRNRAT
ncbi:MAG: sulfotransferase family protein [Chloroflexi bacterium]|nr:MAG: sulfotransferase family protein [Chloroflexota bacterium]